MTVRIIAACGAGVNSSHQIKDALEGEMEKRGYDVHCDAIMIKDLNEDLMNHYDIYAQITKVDMSFTPKIPIVDASAILYRLPAMTKPVFDEVERIIRSKGLD